MKRFPVPKVIKDFSAVFTDAGFSLYIVGGAVRDFLTGTPNHDYDFCTDALPGQVMGLFRHVIPTGIKHGTVTVLFKGRSFEVTTFRTESEYTDRRHPDTVQFVSSLEEDLSRRDFTVNAFAADCQKGRITDLFDGYSDLKKKLIRAIGNPVERFTEDALRLLRMCRFCAKLGFTPDPDTLAAAKALCQSIENVSAERICDELNKTLMSPVPSTGLRLVYETGIMDSILPELAACAKVPQEKILASNVLEHTLNAVDAAAYYGYSLTVRWALLLHDIGKPLTVHGSGGETTFYGHDRAGAQAAAAVMQRLRFPNKMAEDVKVLIENHMILYRPEWTDAAVKRFINRVGRERVNLLFELQWCDRIATVGKAGVREYDSFIQRIEEVQKQPLTLKDLAVNGEDLASAGIPRGPQMGKILAALLEAVIDDPSINTKTQLLNRVNDIITVQ